MCAAHHSKVWKQPQELKVREEARDDVEHNADGPQVRVHLAGQVGVLDLHGDLMPVSSDGMVLCGAHS